MEIIIERKYKKADYTIGRLVASPQPSPEGEGVCYACDTLEPPIGTEKEMITSGSGKAIPPGIYKVRLVFSPKFQQYLPCLDKVPGRFGILIHAGNSIRDTRGCILVGKNTRPGKVLQSKEVLNNFINKIRKAENKREEVMLEIR